MNLSAKTLTRLATSSVTGTVGAHEENTTDLVPSVGNGIKYRGKMFSLGEPSIVRARNPF